MPEDNNDWLRNLSVGDQVIISPSASYVSDYLATVTQITPTQIHVAHAKFRRMDGRQVGGDKWHFANLREPTPEAIAAIREREQKVRLANKFSGTRWGRLPLSVLEEIERIVGEHMPKERKNNA